MTRWTYYASAERGAQIMAGYTASDLCPYCGHDGYDGHDMRSVPPECMTPGCPCGESAASRDRRLDRWIEATLGMRLHRYAVDRDGTIDLPPIEAPGYWERVYRRWAQLYRRNLPEDDR